MKRFRAIGCVILFLLLSVCHVQGAPISLKQAEQYASEHLQRFIPLRGQSLKLLYTSSGIPTRGVNDGKTYYVFGSQSGRAFAIVAGDDLLPPILGYSLTDTFDGHQLPVQLQAYLAGYSRWVEMARAKNVSVRAEVLRDETSVVTPLLQGLAWNQDAPYNNLTPTENGQHTLTGCVATAVAQIMRYFAWPKKAVGSVGSLPDFGQAPYAWDKMPNSCIARPIEEQNAVALLMRDVGHAANMHYGLTESGAVNYDAYKALVNHFGYAPSLRCISQRYYTNREWQEVLIKELKAKHPIYYSGTSQPNAGHGGHAFVCDGYDGNGYFHFNWGWGGKSNGYFVLYKLSPGSVVLGGGAGAYSFDSEAIVGFEPSVTYSGDAVVGNYLCDAIVIPDTEPAESDKTVPLKAHILSLQNKSNTPILTSAALAVIDADGKERLRTQSQELPRIIQDDNVIGGAPILLNLSELPDGVYTLRPWAYMVDHNRYAAVRMRELYKKVVTIEISNGKKRILLQEAQPRLEIEWKTPALHTSTPNRATFTVRNTGSGTYYSYLQAVYSTQESAPSNLNSRDLIINEFLSLGAGDERTYTLPIKGPFDEQERYIHFFYDSQNKWFNLSTKLAPDAFFCTTIGHKPSFVLGTAEIEVLETNASHVLKSGETLYVKLRVATPANKGVYVRLASYIPVNGFKEYVDYNNLLLLPGETQEITIAKDISLPAGQYALTFRAREYVTGFLVHFNVEGASASLPVPDYSTQPQEGVTVNAPIIEPAEGGKCVIERTDGLPFVVGEKVAIGTLLQILPQANDGWEIESTQIVGAEHQGGESYRVMADVFVTLKLKKKENQPQPSNTYKLLRIDIVGSGTVRVLSEAHSVEIGETIRQGAKILIAATPNTDWELRDENITVSPAQKGDGAAEWIPEGDFTVKVTFTEAEKPKPPINPEESFQFLALNVTGKGSVKVFCNNEEVVPQGRIKRGEKITIVATPEEGWEALPANLRVTASEKISDYEWKPKGDFVIGMLFMLKPPPPTPKPEPPTPPTPTGVDEIDYSLLTVAPNPFTEELKILRQEEWLGMLYYEIINARGITMRMGHFDSNELVLDTHNLPAGLYLVRILLQNSVVSKTFRVIKK
jgi:thiol protease/hemagglutinin prtT